MPGFRKIRALSCMDVWYLQCHLQFAGLAILEAKFLDPCLDPSGEYDSFACLFRNSLLVETILIPRSDSRTSTRGRLTVEDDLLVATDGDARMVSGERAETRWS